MSKKQKTRIVYEPTDADYQAVSPKFKKKIVKSAGDAPGKDADAQCAADCVCNDCDCDCSCGSCDCFCDCDCVVCNCDCPACDCFCDCAACQCECES